MTRVILSRRALLDIAEIETSSHERWGAAVADRYLADLQAGLRRLAAFPALLQARQEESDRLHFYRVRQHILVCDATPKRILVLTIWHGSMDLAKRLQVWEPTLVGEATWLHRRLQQIEEKKGPPPAGA